MASHSYFWVARYYDHLFEFRRPFVSARARILNPLLANVTSACDLCCGTGTFALQLAQDGIEVYAVDLSAEMCRLTKGKVRRTGLPVTVIQSDMRDFRLPEQVDLVTCEFDALNHVPQKRDLGRVLRSVARALKPGGHFIFDVNNRPAFECIWSTTWFLDKDPVAIVMHGTHKKGTDRAWLDVEFFLRKGKTYQRHQEHVEEVCWSANEIREALKRAGFDQIRTWDAAPFFKDPYTRPGFRTFWRARRTADGRGRSRGK